MWKYNSISRETCFGKNRNDDCLCKSISKQHVGVSEEYNPQSLVQRGLNHIIKVTSQDEFYKVNLENYKTLCIDYLELFDQNKIINIIEKKCIKKLIQI